MKTPLWMMSMALSALIGTSLASPAVASAVRTHVKNASAESVEVSDAWAMPSMGAAGISAAYFTIINRTTEDIVLVSLRTPVAQSAELHAYDMQDDIMRMRKVDTLAIPAGQRLELKPGGYHVMLQGTAQPLKVGASFPLTLVFSGASDLKIDVPVTGEQPPASKVQN